MVSAPYVRIEADDGQTPCKNARAATAARVLFTWRYFKAFFITAFAAVPRGALSAPL